MIETECETDRKLTRTVAINAFGKSVIREAERYYVTDFSENFWDDLSDEWKIYYIINAWLKAGNGLENFQEIVKALAREDCLVF